MQRQSKIRFHDSGVPRVETIPSTWELIPLKRLGRFESGENITADSIEVAEQYPVYGGNGLRGYTKSYSHEGDYVLVGRQGALCGNVNYAAGKFWASEHAVTVKPKSDVAVRWLGELLRAMNLGQYSQSAAQPGLSVEFVSNLKVPVPPPEEQRTIAAYLDRKTTQIDAVVAKKQRLIERLQEKRQALISHAVTKGLDPNAPMKDSGIEWLGEIPAHWVIKRLKHISPRIGVGLVINPSTYVKDEGVPFLFGGDIQAGKILIEKCRRMSDEDSRKLPQSRLHPGDLVTVRVGYPGITAVIPPELGGANCASVMVVRGAASFVSQWLCYAMNSTVGSDQIKVVKYGAAQEQFNISHAVEFIFPVPPKQEQQRLADHLDCELQRLSGIEERLTSQITKLAEYRRTLISAAVTGKIDVTQEPADD